MPFSFLQYPLSSGYVHHWLVAGPLDISTSTPEGTVTSPRLPELADSTEVDGVPVDPRLFGELPRTGPPPLWRYVRCREDHFVDFTPCTPRQRFHAGCCAVILTSPTSQEVNLALTFCGQVQLWVNQQPLLKEGSVSQTGLQTVSCAVELQPGNNRLMVRLFFTGLSGAMNVVALHVDEQDTRSTETLIPTQIEAEYLEKRMQLEEIAEAAYLDRYVYGYLDGDRYNRNQPVHLHFTEQLPFSGEITFRLQSLLGDIFQEGTSQANPAGELEMARTFPLRSGPHHLALLPTADLYYEKKLRFERKELFFVARSPFNQTAAPTDSKERVRLALKDASERRGDSLYSEIAKMALDSWDNLDVKILQDAAARVIQRSAGAVEDTLGLLGMLIRFGKKRAFPKEIKPILQDAAAGYRYQPDQPANTGPDHGAESRQILGFTCEILAGQLWPKQILTGSGEPGKQRRERAEQSAIDWMRARGKFGFQEWDSPAEIEAVVAALTHLVDLAESDLVSELAAVLLDKIFFNMALNSYQGAYATSRGSSTTAEVLSARLEATSGISRLLWGLGTFNDAVMGTVSLACCKHYDLPDLIERIAITSPAVTWTRAQHCLPFAGDAAPSTAAWRVNKVCYRTADYMLSSAQDYYRGEKGRAEHVWQAALGPDALVFTNHPTCMSEDDSHAPNLWRGNGVLPRVAQWGDVLVAIYHLPEDDWMGFTHAYFPAAAFDQTLFTGEWAFARQGKGYVALSASHGFEFIQAGQTAYRELRSAGVDHTWLCHMGQELLDGSFEQFCQKILQMDVRLSDQALELTSLRGDRLAFGWHGPLMINGSPQPLDGYAHIESPYASAPLPAEHIDILVGETGIRLKFD